MKPFDVYPLLPVTPVRAKGCYLWDETGSRYLDLYGGHAVISIGHAHKAYVRALNAQTGSLGFYSNSVQNTLQKELAAKLGQMSGYPDYQLFLVNSGAEAIENAVKLASFHTGKKKVIACKNGFHGRTSLALGLTDNPGLRAPVNQGHDVEFIAYGDTAGLEKALAGKDVAAVVLEGIQGIAGVYEAPEAFFQAAQDLTKAHGALLIMDEIQSGYGRTGRFFAHQQAGIAPDLITVAKGMGNGFPLGGVLISPEIKSRHGLLGTTFGGTHLACAAGLAVLNVLEAENLADNSRMVGEFLSGKLRKLPVREIRGRGLMIGLSFDYPVKELRQRLLQDFRIFTGTATDPRVLRLLPPLCLNREQAAYFVRSLKTVLTEIKST